jgi:hypothetical protein
LIVQPQRGGGLDLIELLDFNLRGGQDAPVAAARVAYVTERYLRADGAHDLSAVVTEIVAWLGGADPMPQTLRLELSVTSAIVRVAVTVAQRRRADRTIESNQILRETLPVTAALASRYGIETSRRTRIWAEFDRYETRVPTYNGSQYS